MLKFISHRGNLNKIISNEENNPNKILYCLNIGYDVEIDVWLKNENIFLGHDEPQYKVDISFLNNKNLWCHAKNLDAFKLMLDKKINCFWHQNDDFTLTSSGYIWTYPGKKITNSSITVLPEKSNYSNEELKNAYGICSDYIENYKKILNNE